MRLEILKDARMNSTLVNVSEPDFFIHDALVHRFVDENWSSERISWGGEEYALTYMAVQGFLPSGEVATHTEPEGVFEMYFALDGAAVAFVGETSQDLKLPESNLDDTQLEELFTEGTYELEFPENDDVPSLHIKYKENTVFVKAIVIDPGVTHGSADQRQSESYSGSNNPLFLALKLKLV